MLFFFFLQIFRNNVLINMHEYANEIICIFDIRWKGNVYALIWYQLCHAILQTSWIMINLLCIPSLFRNQTGFFFWTNHFAFILSLWTIWCPWKIVLGAGCKVGLTSRRPNINIVFFHLDSYIIFYKVLFSSLYIWLLLTGLENQD